MPEMLLGPLMLLVFSTIRRRALYLDMITSNWGNELKCEYSKWVIVGVKV